MKLSKREIEFLRAIEDAPQRITEWGHTLMSRFKGYHRAAEASLWKKEMIVSTRTQSGRVFRITANGREALEAYPQPEREVM
jgi:predicted transcriptional regulator